uniref:hypothetical protein n=1 Tax=Thermoflexus sp. TaxID=1969742 RepID=UPI0035E45F98
QQEGRSCTPDTAGGEPRCARLVEMAYILGLAQYYLGNCAAARPWFELALSISPQEENALKGLRLCEEGSGRP